MLVHRTVKSWWVASIVTGAVCIGVQGPSASMAAMTLTSSALKAGGSLPKQYTCDGANESPPLAWSDVPTGANTYVLIVEDPDAPSGTWVHWVVYDMPLSLKELPAGVPPSDQLAQGGMQGTNDFHKLGYGGPCPPPGKSHRYVFTLYAVTQASKIKPNATKADVLKAIEGHVIGQAELSATYKR